MSPAEASPSTASAAPSREARSTVTILVFALPFVAAAFHPLQNNDLPLHLAIGDWVLEHRQVPDRDPFSALSADRPWVPHEWLAGVLFTLVERVAGAPGLIGAGMLLAGLLAACAGRVLLALGATPVGLWCAAPLLVLTVSPRILVRPHLPALALAFACWVVVLAGRKRPRWLALLPLCLVLWVNLHSSYTIGLAIALAGLLLGGREHRASRPVRVGLALACCLALLVQPHGVGLLLHPFQLVGDPVFMATVQEWTPPFGSEPGSALYRAMPAFAGFVLCLLAVAWGVRRRAPLLPLAYLLFILGALVLALRHQRFTGLFALASAPLLPWIDWRPGEVSADRARAGPPRVPNGSTPSGTRYPGAGSPIATRVAALAPVLTALLLLYPGLPTRWNQFRRPPWDGQFWSAHLPFAEVQTLRLLGYRGTVVCEYTHGGVLAWVGEGALRPTIDSRNEVYGAERYLAHERGMIAGDPPLVDEACAVLVRAPWQDLDRIALHRRLEQDPRWQLVSFTRDTFLYVRAGQGPARSCLTLPISGRVRETTPEQLEELLVEAGRLLACFPDQPSCWLVYARAHARGARMGADPVWRAEALAQAERALDRLASWPALDPGLAHERDAVRAELDP